MAKNILVVGYCGNSVPLDVYLSNSQSLKSYISRFSEFFPSLADIDLANYNLMTWMDQNPKPKSNNTNELYMWNEEFEIRHSLNKKIDEEKEKWDVSKQRIFAIVTSMDKSMDTSINDNMNLIREFYHSYYLSDNTTKDSCHVDEIWVGTISQSAATYLSIYENPDFVKHIRQVQESALATMGWNVNASLTYNIKSKEKENVKRYETGYNKFTQTYHHDDFDWSFFPNEYLEYVRNAKFGPVISSDYVGDKMLDRVREPELPFSHSDIPTMGYFPIPSLSTPHLGSELLETSGIDTQYGGEELLSTRFNVMNLMILDSYQYMKNDRYYITPDMRKYLPSVWDDSEMKKNIQNNNYDKLIGMGLEGPSLNETMIILQQTGEISLHILRLISIVPNKNVGYISDSKIQMALDYSREKIVRVLGNINNDKVRRLYVEYDERLIIKARNYMDLKLQYNYDLGTV